MVLRDFKPYALEETFNVLYEWLVGLPNCEAYGKGVAAVVDDELLAVMVS